MKTEFSLPFAEKELQEALASAEQGNPSPLRLLCRKEVECFEAAIKQHPHYADGLVLIERRVIEGYLYQKLRGHLDASTGNDALPKER
jgi:hypothetical protein